jgi:Leucine-rich repeat (LRR) protein
MKSSVIPDSVFVMTSLKSLTITGMDCDYRETDETGKDVTQCWMIQEIPKAIKNLRDLEVLQLNVNAIQTIPPEVAALKKLRVLDLTDNSSLRNIENLILLKNSLEELYVHGCYLTDSGPIVKLKKLKRLGAVGNSFNDDEIKTIKSALPGCEIVF